MTRCSECHELMDDHSYDCDICEAPLCEDCAFDHDCGDGEPVQ